MTTTLDQAVSPNQQELITIRAQIASRVPLSESVHATDNLTTAQSFEDGLGMASRSINTNDVGRTKEFSGTEEDFQHWSEDIKAFFAGMIKESEMMLDWAADQTMEISTTAIDLDFLPTDANEDRGVQTWSSCCSRCTQHSWLSRVMKRVTLSPTRGGIRWRHGGDCRSDMIRRQEDETFYARPFLLDGALFWNSKR